MQAGTEEEEEGGGRGQATSPLHSPSLQSEIKGTDLHVMSSQGGAQRDA